MTVKERVEKQNAIIDKLMKSIEDEYRRRNCGNCQHHSLGQYNVGNGSVDYFYCEKEVIEGEITKEHVKAGVKCNNWEA